MFFYVLVEDIKNNFKLFNNTHVFGVPRAVLDFRHAHLHKCKYFFLGASKIFTLHAHVHVSFHSLVSQCFSRCAQQNDKK